MPVADTIEFRRLILEEEYPEVRKLGKAVLEGVLQSPNLEVKSLPGSHMDLNQDWPVIIAFAKELVSVISEILIIIVSLKELSHSSNEEVERKVLEKLTQGERGKKRLETVGERRLRSIAKRVVDKR